MRNFLLGSGISILTLLSVFPAPNIFLAAGISFLMQDFLFPANWYRICRPFLLILDPENASFWQFLHQRIQKGSAYGPLTNNNWRLASASPKEVFISNDFFMLSTLETGNREKSTRKSPGSSYFLYKIFINNFN